MQWLLCAGCWNACCDRTCLLRRFALRFAMLLGQSIAHTQALNSGPDIPPGIGRCPTTLNLLPNDLDQATLDKMILDLRTVHYQTQELLATLRDHTQRLAKFDDLHIEQANLNCQFSQILDTHHDAIAELQDLTRISAKPAVVDASTSTQECPENPYISDTRHAKCLEEQATHDDYMTVLAPPFNAAAPASPPPTQVYADETSTKGGHSTTLLQAIVAFTMAPRTSQIPVPAPSAAPPVTPQGLAAAQFVTSSGEDRLASAAVQPPKRKPGRPCKQLPVQQCTSDTPQSAD
eukprot:3982731-Amphidinium_carterae.1